MQRQMYENFRHANCLDAGLLLILSDITIANNQQWKMQSCSTVAHVHNCLSTAWELPRPPLINKVLAKRTINSLLYHN